MADKILALIGLCTLLILLLPQILKVIKLIGLILQEIIKLFGDLVHTSKKSFGKRHSR